MAKHKPKDEKFLKELFDLCQKYEANFSTTSLEFKSGVKYDWVEVHGQWPVRDDAVRAERVKSDAIIEQITIPGTLAIKGRGFKAHG